MVGVAEGGDVAGWSEGSLPLGLFVWIATAVGEGRCPCTVEIEDVVSELPDVVWIERRGEGVRVWPLCPISVEREASSMGEGVAFAIVVVSATIVVPPPMWLSEVETASRWGDLWERLLTHSPICSVQGRGYEGGKLWQNPPQPWGARWGYRWYPPL